MHQAIIDDDADYVEVCSRRQLDKWGLIHGAVEKPTVRVIEQPRLLDDYYISFFGVNRLSVTM